ncbi:hypothetical protein CWI36_0195p0040 [Hamiltosporidium magnivora]|uniref:Uncharacterized protein n=1 Tax=Hamiltosporidium magnivora TaxID=148818 RepID=A0A4V2JWH7_9MICR|nr:hypothetical protein CWI36_0195p0040 [Hamiltosporidium magnivora]
MQGYLDENGEEWTENKDIVLTNKVPKTSESSGLDKSGYIFDSERYYDARGDLSDEEYYSSSANSESSKENRKFLDEKNERGVSFRKTPINESTEPNDKQAIIVNDTSKPFGLIKNSSLSLITRGKISNFFENKFNMIRDKLISRRESKKSETLIGNSPSLSNFPLKRDENYNENERRKAVKTPTFNSKISFLSLNTRKGSKRNSKKNNETGKSTDAVSNNVEFI